MYEEALEHEKHERNERHEKVSTLRLQAHSSAQRTKNESGLSGEAVIFRCVVEDGWEGCG